MTVLRLQKYMSECGICSRRHAEEAIARGDVTVNGTVAIIGQSVDPEHDTIEYGGQMVKRDDKRVYYAMNKPRGIETTCAQKGGESIVDIIDAPTRVFPIGRLDKDSSGLILLTNDGRITHRLLHPSFEHEKEYLVTVYGKITDIALQTLSSGVRYAITEGPKTDQNAKSKVQSAKWQNMASHHPERVKNPPFWIFNSSLWIWAKRTKYVQTVPCEIKRVSSDTFLIVLTEGKNRQIRRMVEACGFQVKRLKRIRIEHIQLADMPEGAYRELKRGEREELLRRACLPLVEYPAIVGEVIHGNGHGHSLGYPTANIALSGSTLPDEVFSCRVKLGDEVFLGAWTYNSKKEIQNAKCKKHKVGDPAKGGEGMVINSPSFWGGGTIGKKMGVSITDGCTPPTPSEWGGVGKSHGIFEVHILWFDRDIYGQILHIEIMDSLRPNRTFTSPEELKAQIAKDVNHVRAHWSQILRI